ncbi:hypothetical protein ACIA49_03470 [Kribbella sp. NPDC051587]|uniref:hypothetical protein n=1 Tax=Kribbella sp. NPDC051587 TaxID=3364119 RepID=UPI003796A7FC
MENTLAVDHRRGMTLIPSGGLYHPAWCEQLVDCEQHGHSSPTVHGETKRTHSDRPEMRWSLHVSERDGGRGTHVWGMLTVANDIHDTPNTAVLMCDPIEAFKLGHDLIAASGYAYAEPAPAAVEDIAARPKLEVVR